MYTRKEIVMTKKEKVEMEVFSVRLDPKLIKRIDKLAVKADVERGRLIRNILEMQIKYLEKIDKLGLFTLTVILRDLEDSFREWVEEVKENPELTVVKGYRH
jgi:metal-responsive CopG/Arc/MetJ family transcriptional regulator